MALYKIYPIDSGSVSTTELQGIGEYSQANKRIQTVGVIHRANSNEGVLWERLDNMYPPLKGFYFPYNQGAAIGLNNIYPSQVVGWIQQVDSPNHVPFLFEKNGPTVLNTLGGAVGEARSINDNGDIAGWSLLNNGQRRACLWQTAAHQILDLGTLGGTESEAYAINNQGQVVGWALDGNGNTHAFIWTPGAADGIPGNPQMKDIHLAGYGESIAMALNDNGHAVGKLQQPADEAFFWSPNSGAVRLPSLGYSATAKGINNEDLIVGQSQGEAGVTPRAVFWSNFHIADLNELLVQNTAWIITDATAVNSDGFIACNAHIGLKPVVFRYGLVLDPLYRHFPPGPYGTQADMFWDKSNNTFPEDFMVLTQMTASSSQLEDKARKEKVQQFLLKMIKETIKIKG